MTHLLMPTKVLFILGVSPGSPAKHPSDLAKQGLRRLLKWCHSCDSRSSEFAKGRGLKQKWRNVAVAPRTAKQPLLHLIIEVTQCWLFAVFQRNCKRFVECYSVDRTRDVYLAIFKPGYRLRGCEQLNQQPRFQSAISDCLHHIYLYRIDHKPQLFISYS